MNDLVPQISQMIHRLSNGDYFYIHNQPDVNFYFNNFNKTHLGWEVEVRIEAELPASKNKSFCAKTNFLSLTSRETFVRHVEKILGKEIDWHGIITNVFTELKEYIENEDRSIALEDIEEQKGVEYLIDPFIVEGGPNIFFGKGGTSKTYLSLKIALSLMDVEDFLGVVPARSIPILFVDYEASAGTINRRIHSLTNKEIPKGLFRYFAAGGVPIADNIMGIKRAVKRYGIELIIIDSAALACGGRPEDAQTAVSFFNALASIGVTSLTIAHETKAETGNYPFGSVFFWNSPRNIWNVKGVQEQDDRVLEVGLFHRKANDGGLKSPVGVRVWFDPSGKVEIKKSGLPDEWNKEYTIKQRIWRALRDNPRSIAELREEFEDIKEDTLKRTLTRMKGSGKLDNIGGVWMLLSTGDKKDVRGQVSPVFEGGDTRGDNKKDIPF